MYRKAPVCESLFDKVAGRHLFHRTPPEGCFLSVQITNSDTLTCSALNFHQHFLEITLCGTDVSNNFHTFESFNSEFIFVKWKYTHQEKSMDRLCLFKFIFYGRTFSTKNLIKAIPKVLNEACALKLRTYQLQPFLKVKCLFKILERCIG